MTGGGREGKSITYFVRGDDLHDDIFVWIGSKKLQRFDRSLIDYIGRASEITTYAQK